MANLFEAQTDELCYVSIEDVRDSLWGVFLATATPLITDEEIGILIVKAQKQVNVYLNAINPNICCDGMDCEDIPIDIQRATLQLIDNIYTSETEEETAVETFTDGRRIKSETTACWVSLTYEYDDICWESSECSLVDCNTRTLLNCYEIKSSNLSFNCSSCPCGFSSSFHCFKGTCNKPRPSNWCTNCSSNCDC